MEKITYPPLIAHLKAQADFYNEQYKAHEIKHGSIESALLIEWTVAVAEPIIQKVDEWNPKYLPAVFNAVFSKLLNCLSDNYAVAHTTEVQAALAIAQYAPACVATAPTRILNALYSAARSIREHQGEKVFDWVEGMELSAPYCRNVEEFLNCGRVCAWLCGMAHLRPRAITAYETFSERLKQSFLKNTAADELTLAFQKPWLTTNTGEFKGVVGGFTGYGGPFKFPPILAKFGNYIFATDGIVGVALFADQFGKVVLSQKYADPDLIRALQEQVATPRNKYPDDTATSAIVNNTLFLTRNSSHYVYVYTA